ncbi:flavin reductase family protein [Streptomyces sp. NPDC052693]|uniref:flavin reductase family protein n=1 Tax=Streptomyces sp. NPDC052693 TaxID=3155814 RepID=UPI0034236B1F
MRPWCHSCADRGPTGSTASPWTAQPPRRAPSPGGAATLIVRPYRHIPAGDHELVLFEVVDHRRDDEAAPLTYHDRHVGALHHERL